MQNRVKPVQFDFFTPYFIEKNADNRDSEKILDLNRIFSSLESERKYVFKISGDDYVLQRYERDSQYTYIWKIQILRVRDTSIPGVYDERDSSYEFMRLEDGKSFAESTTVLYDSQTYLFMMQRNKFAVSVENCQYFLAELCQCGVSLKVRTPQNIFRKIKKDSRYKKIVLTADTKELNADNKNGSLGQILNMFSKYNGRVVKIEISVDRMRDRELNSAELVELIGDAYVFPGIKKLQVRGAAPEDIEFDTIDLLADRQHIRLDVEYNSKNPISHERLTYLFLREYIENCK